MNIGLTWNPPPCLELSWLDDWFLGFSAQCLSSQKYTRGSHSHGRHLSLPEHGSQVLPPSLQLMAGWSGGTQRLSCHLEETSEAPFQVL